MNLDEQFEELSLDQILDLINSGQEEHLNLDFKTISKADFSNTDDKKNLAKALSGFSNSNGGLIVWGVLAKKNNFGIDQAQGVKEIYPLSLLLSKLNELTSRATSPPNDGVRHKILSISSDTGIAVTYVPESDIGPHMAKLSEDRYYKRSGDTFYKMEHYDLEDMFGRRKKPKLEITCRKTGEGAKTAIILGIKNSGRGTAKTPYLAFNIPKPFNRSTYGLDGNGNDGLPKLKHAEDFRHRYGANTLFVIHPGTTHEIASVDMGMTPNPQSIPKGEIKIDYEILAEDTLPVRGTINLGFVSADN